MRRVKSQGTNPELAVRSLLRRANLRFTYHPKKILGNPDFARVRDKVAIFVHGCFWHGHFCKRGARVPKSNKTYWINKIRGNRCRDRAVQKALAHSGWRIFLIWECDLQSGVDAIRSAKL